MVAGQWVGGVSASVNTGLVFSEFQFTRSEGASTQSGCWRGRNSADGKLLSA
jgi:hypothetical protein